MNARQFEMEEKFVPGSASLNKITLSSYRSKLFSATWEDHPSLLFGDSAMGLPFYKALNTHLMCINSFIEILQNSHYGASPVFVDEICDSFDGMMQAMYEKQTKMTQKINDKIDLYQSYFDMMSLIPNRLQFFFTRHRTANRKQFEEVEHEAFKKKEGFSSGSC
jgi:hypothetical protein